MRVFVGYYDHEYIGARLTFWDANTGLMPHICTHDKRYFVLLMPSALYTIMIDVFVRSRPATHIIVKMCVDDCIVSTALHCILNNRVYIPFLCRREFIEKKLSIYSTFVTMTSMIEHFEGSILRHTNFEYVCEIHTADTMCTRYADEDDMHQQQMIMNDLRPRASLPAGFTDKELGLLQASAKLAALARQ